MIGASYNGYSGRQRDLILKAYHRGDAGPDFTLASKPCGLCGDPDRAPNEWHFRGLLAAMGCPYTVGLRLLGTLNLFQLAQKDGI